MTHEFIHIIARALQHQQEGQQTVLATVVALDGSSYRKPGVRMLMAEDGTMTGAVSGGCVEDEVFRRARSVFETGQPRMMTYDGRYRLGCEGVLYILLEPFQVSEALLSAFSDTVQKRRPFRIESHYLKQDEAGGAIGSEIILDDKSPFSFQENKTDSPGRSEGMALFVQELQPRFRLLIVGGEHDSVKLCQIAALLGWEVEVITSWRDTKSAADFPGAARVSGESPDEFDPARIDADTAVVLMTHNFSLDLKYLLQLKDCQPAYLGMIGATNRRERLQDQLLTLAPDTSLEFLEHMHSPAGLDLGAITPEEIALSILAEIQSLVRQTTARSLSSALRTLPTS